MTNNQKLMICLLNIISKFYFHEILIEFDIWYYMDQRKSDAKRWNKFKFSLNKICNFMAVILVYLHVHVEI